MVNPERVDTLITGGIVVTMDQEYRVLPDGALAIRDGRIVAVGDSGELKEKYTGKQSIDARRKLVLPGLINAHTHVPMNIYRGFADDMNLNQWLFDHIFPLETAFTQPGNVRLGTRLAMAEMLRSGTTTFNDMYYYSDLIADEVDACGMRAVVSEAIVDEPFHKKTTPDEILDFTRSLAASWENHPRIRVAVAVHAPFTAGPSCYKKAYDLALSKGLLLHTHLSETRWEFDHIRERYGKTPVGYLEELGVLHAGLVAAHAIHLSPEDQELLARYDVGVAHNPQCNMKLANGIAPIPDLIQMGIRVGIGTDGVASNNDLDLFDEMRSAALAHKLTTGDPTVMDARTVLESVTRGGARLLGLDHMVGSLEKAKQADLILVDLSKPHAWPVYNVYSLIVYSLRGSDVDTVMVDGRLLMQDRKLMTIDEGSLYEEVQDLSHRIRQWQMNRSTLASS